MRDERPGCGDLVLAALIVLIVAVCMMDSCPAHAQKRTEMEEKAHDVLNGKPDPVEPEPVVWSLEDPEPAEEHQDDEGGSPLWLLAVPLPLIAIIVLAIGAARRLDSRKKKKLTRTPTPKCPACDKAYDGHTLPLPRLVIPRKVFNLGRIQISWPETEEDQHVEVCPACYEVGLMLARVERERMHERRAKDRTTEMVHLMSFQQGLMVEIKKIRYPDEKNGSA